MLPRFPLRSQHLDALRDQVAVKGSRQIAFKVGTSQAEVEEIVAGRTPTTLARQKVITYLVQNGLSKHRGDPYRPDGSEPEMTSHEKKALRASGEVSNDDHS